MDKQNRIEAEHISSQTASRAAVNPTEDQEEHSSSLLLSGRDRQEKSRKSELYLSPFVEERSHLLVRSVGYGLIVLALFDYAHILIPLYLTDPVWEFQTIGALVEHAAIPLLGLMFIFYRHEGYIRGLEKKLLGFLSWVSLLLGLLYLLMLPLGVADTWRIYNANKAEISTQLSQQSQPLQQLKVQLNQAKTDEQLEQLLAKLTPKGRAPQIKNPQAFKDQLLAKISQTQWSIKAQANMVAGSQRQLLIKNSVKWNLGAMVTGILFIWTWLLTDWVRIKE